MKKNIIFVLMITVLLSLPGRIMAETTIGQDVSLDRPVYSGMETKEEMDAINTQISQNNGSAELSEDKMFGKYSAKITIGNNPDKRYEEFNLVSTELFDINNYGKIELYIKPAMRASWIEFYTNGELILSDGNKDGRYEVGKDITMGKWNNIVLDLTNTKNNIEEAQNVQVRVNENSVWFFDEISSQKSNFFNIDIPRMINSATEVTDDGLQFKSSGTDTYNITPTILTTNNLYPIFEKTHSTQADFTGGTLQNVTIDPNGSIQFNGLTDQCTGGTPISSTGDPSKAFDDSTSISWYSIEQGGNVSGKAYIGYDFGSPKCLQKVEIKLSASSSYRITSAKLQYLDNSTGSWTDLKDLTFTTSTGWQDFYTYSNISANKWRILANSNPSNGWEVVEINFLHSSGVYTSPVIDINVIDECSGAKANYVCSKNADIFLETRISVDGGVTWQDWEKVTAEGEIPAINHDIDLSNTKFQYRASISKPGSIAVPTLEEISFKIFEKTNDRNLINNEKIERVNINSTYSRVAAQNLDLILKSKFSIVPTIFALSGNGKKLYYVGTDTKLYLLDINTGLTSLVEGTIGIGIVKTNYDGSIVVFIVTSTSPYRMYYINFNISSLANNVGYVISNEKTIKILDDGTVYFIYNTYDLYKYKLIDGIYTKMTIKTDIDSLVFVMNKAEDKVFYCNSNIIKCLTYTPNGWQDETLYTGQTGKSYTDLFLSKDETQLFLSGDSANTGIYAFNIGNKSIRKLNTSSTTISKLIDDDKIFSIQNKNFILYDPLTEKETIIRQADTATSSNVDIDYSGNKLVYISTSNQLCVSYVNEPERPERFLLSFDEKKTWYSYKDDSWILVRQADAPIGEDFENYGMTIDEVNGLTETDFDYLYEEGINIYTVDFAEYFTSLDPYTTPNLKKITVFTKQDSEVSGDTYYGKALYAAKKQEFDATNWRKVAKIYPIEMSPKESSVYYFISVDDKYRYFDGTEWQEETTDELATLLNDVEANWIEITQKGMTAKTLKSIPESFLTSALATKEFSVVYCMKVLDKSTEKYYSKITVDYVQDLFVSDTLTLQVTLSDGTTKQFAGLTATEIEDFMEWVNKRQYQIGPIFYTIKTGGTNYFINYYMIQAVDVDET